MKFQQLRRLFLDTGDFKLIVYSLQETDNCPYLAGEAHQRASPDGSGGRGGPFPSRCRGSARGLSSKGACSMRADCFTMNWLPRRTTGCSSRSISSRSWRSRCRTRTKSCGMTGASFQNMLSLRKIRANLRRRQLILSLRNWAASARTPGNAQANRTGCSSGSSTVGNVTPCHRIWIPDPSSPVLPMPAPSPVSLRKRNNITERL